MADKNKILVKAQQYALKGYLERAIKEYNKIVEVDPEDIIVRLRLGELYAKMGKKEEAVEEYSEVATVQSKKGFFLKAIAVYKQILRIDDSNIDVHLKVGELYNKQGLVADAISQYSQVVERYKQAGSHNEAVNVLKKMLEIDPNNMLIKTKLADTLYEGGFIEDAIAEFEVIAKGFIVKGEPDEAEKIYRRFLKDGIDNKIKALNGLLEVYKIAQKNGALLETYRKLLKLYIESGLEKESKEICRDILEIKPNDREALEILDEGKPAETGEELLEDMVEVLPEEYVDLVAELGLDEETPASEVSVESSREWVERTTEDGDDLETHYYMGVAYMETGLLDEAVKELKEASSSPKVGYDSFVRLGLCYMRKKEPKEAIRYFEKGLELPRDKKDKYSLFYELGLAYESMGDQEKALEFFKEIEKEDKDFREVRQKVETLSAGESDNT